MNTHGLIMTGVDGLVEKHIVFLEIGFNGSIGRSKKCDVTLNDCIGFQTLTDDQDDAKQKYNTISRRHATIQIEEFKIIFRDASTNGTFLNRRRLKDDQELKVEEVESDTYELRLGNTETFVLSWGEDPNLLEDEK